MEKIKSPITGNYNTKVIRWLNSYDIINNYKIGLKIDVSKYFEKTPKVLIVKCLDSGFCFYYPENIAGDGFFYEQLQKNDWYYMPWKWEHEMAKSTIQINSDVLEIGCAEGNFLENLTKTKNCNCVGIELNNTAYEKAKDKGIDVLRLNIEEFSVKNAEKFDVVCSFQVLEHITNVKPFILAQISCLKKGGTLIVSVPNNDSFLKHSYNILNMPPHHSGLWNRKALKRIAPIFNLELIKIALEPPQDYHKQYFYDTLKDYLRRRYKVPYRVLPIVTQIWSYFCSDSYKAFTIQATYIKNN